MFTFVSAYKFYLNSLLHDFVLAKFVKMQYVDMKMCFNTCQMNVDINNPVQYSKQAPCGWPLSQNV